MSDRQPLHVFARTGLAWVGLLASAALCLGLHPTSASAQQSAAEVYASVRSGASWRVGSETIEAPATGRGAWQSTRQSLGLANSSIAWRGRTLSETLNALSELHHEELLEWEASLIAAYVTSGDISITRAQHWIRLLRAPPASWATEEARGRIAQLRLFELSSALAALPPRCLSVTDETMGLLETLAAQEDSVPGRRYGSRFRGGPDLPEDLAGALDSPHAQLVFAGVYAIASLFPSEDILGELLRSTGYTPPAQSCAIDAVMLVADAPYWSVGDWNEKRAQLQALTNDGLLVQRWIWRIGIHQYLQGNENALRDLLGIYGDVAPEDQPGHALFTTLAQITDGQVNHGDAAPPPTSYWLPATYRWVIGEYHRVAGRNEEAIAYLSRAVDDDGDFVAAHLSLSAAQLALRRYGDALQTLSVIRDVAPPVPIYTFWYEQLNDALADAVPEDRGR